VHQTNNTLYTLYSISPSCLVLTSLHFPCLPPMGRGCAAAVSRRNLLEPDLSRRVLPSISFFSALIWFLIFLLVLCSSLLFLCSSLLCSSLLLASLVSGKRGCCSQSSKSSRTRAFAQSAPFPLFLLCSHLVSYLPARSLLLSSLSLLFTSLLFSALGFSCQREARLLQSVVKIF
jgi:hypothetical protein